MKLDMALYKALVASNVPEQHATAVIDAMEKEMTSVLASKNDLSEVRTELKAEITKVANDLKTVEQSLLKEMAHLNTTLTVRMVVVMTALQGIAGSLLFAALRFFK